MSASIPVPKPGRNTHDELIGEALAELVDLDELDLEQAIGRLTTATRALSQALDAPSGATQAPFSWINQ